MKSLDNVIDRIAVTCLTAEEQAERKEKQTQDAKLVVPKIFEKAKKSKKAAAAFRLPVAPLPPPPPVPAVAPVVTRVYRAGRVLSPPSRFSRARDPAWDEDEDDEDYDEDDEDEDEDDEDDDGEPLGDPMYRTAQVHLERSPSGRATCRGCRTTIGCGEIRFGVIGGPESYGYGDYYQSPKYWHTHCFMPKLNRRRHPNVDSFSGRHVLTPVERATLQALFVR